MAHCILVPIPSKLCAALWTEMTNALPHTTLLPNTTTSASGSMDLAHQHEEDEPYTKALAHAFAMIIVSEIGDKTFLIAAILAMRNPRLVIFAGAFGSLVVMSILSAEMGHLLPSLVPRKWTQLAAATLFLVFGLKMLLEARSMKAGNSKIQEEMKEVEEELETDTATIDGTGRHGENGEVIPLEEIEEGGGRPHNSPNRTRPPSRTPWSQSVKNLLHLLFGPSFVQAFILTFLGEWGDRSQIATIALGANHNVYVIALGTIIGHGCCTALAVLGGRYLSTKISVKHVTLGGAVLFLLFAVIYFHEAWTSADSPAVHVLHPEHAQHEVDWVPKS